MKQRPEELVYRLLEGPAPRELLRVLAEKTVALPWGEATLAIIGSSHFLEVRAGGETVTEVLASSRPGLGTFTFLEQIYEGRGGRSLRIGGGLDYEFRMDVTEHRAEGFGLETRRISQAKPNRLFFQFPGGDGGPGAVTCLDWRVDHGLLAVETYHTFPGELAVVRSRTTIGVPERGIAP